MSETNTERFTPTQALLVLDVGDKLSYSDAPLEAQSPKVILAVPMQASLKTREFVLEDGYWTRIK